MTEVALAPDAKLVEAVRAIEHSRRRMAVVVSPAGKVVGTLTDGDVRRKLLAGGTLQVPVAEAMNTSPLTALNGSSDRYLLDIMRRRNVMAVPLVDGHGRFIRMVHLIDLSPNADAPTSADFAFAVIMAGGEGQRLRPITEKMPKPMVDIGGVPLLTRQLTRLAKAGLRDVYISLNYLGHMIEEFLGDGASYGLNIRYLREQEKLGTAGALSLLPERPNAPIIVMNGDILTTSDFRSLSEFHANLGAFVTVAAVEYNIGIPFGVLYNDGPVVTGLAEKPSQRFLCNAGIYVLSPQALNLIPTSTHYNMTDLIDLCLRDGKQVNLFPVHEFWSDIGTAADLDNARRLFTADSEQQTDSGAPWGWR